MINDNCSELHGGAIKQAIFHAQSSTILTFKHEAKRQHYVSKHDEVGDILNDFTLTVEERETTQTLPGNTDISDAKLRSRHHHPVDDCDWFPFAKGHRHIEPSIRKTNPPWPTCCERTTSNQELDQHDCVRRTDASIQTRHRPMMKILCGYHVHRRYLSRAWRSGPGPEA
jgi:hypothetical protein